MTIEGKVAEVRRFCRRHADEGLARRYAQYFVEGYDAYGVEQGVLERQRELWLAKWREELGRDGLLRLGGRLVESGKYEEGSVAVWFASALEEGFTPAVLDRLGGWLDGGIRNWAHTDYLSLEVLSRFLTRGIVPLKALAGWRGAPSRWKRRAVPVTLIRLLRTDVPVPRLLRFLAPMMRDPERVVHQGLGWFLREAWKRDPGAVEGFLLERLESCPRLVVRTATEKMTPARRARFARSRPARASRAPGRPRPRPTPDLSPGRSSSGSPRRGPRRPS